ncbi:MAG: hypothetical protein ACOCX4_10560, partial [Planctomycetota bacterium]
PAGATVLLFTEGLDRAAEAVAGGPADAFFAACVRDARAAGVPSADVVFDRLREGADGMLPTDDMTVFSMDRAG